MTTVRPARVVTAKGFWKWLLNRTGFAAITMPWRTIYVQRQYRDHHGLIRHEMVHIEQIDRDGPIAFSAKYLWWLARYGYHENPYEAEAYRREPIEQ